MIRSDERHAVYIFDIIDNFDFFFNAVEPQIAQGTGLVDYSEPRFHRVRGYDLHEVLFPAIAEPLPTTEQYLSFAALGEGSVAIDLGAYSGLTSIMFGQRCGDTGRVIAVEADRGNIDAAKTNFALFERATGQRIELLEGAVWSHNDGISFSTEGSMGSSATDIVGKRTGEVTSVETFTLSRIAEHFGLARIDFIKCDIEGGEAEIFLDAAFFERFRPRIMVEVHPVKGVMTTDSVRRALARYGYELRLIAQDGVELPLLECSPLEAAPPGPGQRSA